MENSGWGFPPSINVLGAYFPDWMFCIIAGVILTVIIDVIQGKLELGHWMRPMTVTYPVLTVLFSLSTWLIFFPR